MTHTLKHLPRAEDVEDSVISTRPFSDNLQRGDIGFNPFAPTMRDYFPAKPLVTHALSGKGTKLVADLARRLNPRVPPKGLWPKMVPASFPNFSPLSLAFERVAWARTPGFPVSLLLSPLAGYNGPS